MTFSGGGNVLKLGMAAAGLALLAQSAWGEEAPSPSAGLDEIVITAQREEESLQRAALPVSVLSPDTLTDAGVTQPADLSHLAPSLQVSGLSSSWSVFYIRGVGNFTGNSLADPAVTFNFDGVSIGRPSSTTGFFYDLERVEILRGPQGTLYGRNATGGAINVLPRRAELGRFGGELVAEYGEHEWMRVDGALNAPLGDRAALRFAATRVAHAGFMSDGADDQDDLGARLSFLLEPNEALSISIVADWFQQGGRGRGSTPIALGPDNRFGLSSPQAAAFYQGQRHAIGGRNFHPIPPMQRQDNELWGVNATVTWETDAGALTLIPAYRESSIDSVFGATGLTLTTVEHDEQASFEARWAFDPTDRLHVLVGGILFEESNDVPLFVPNNQYSISFQRPFTDTESAAAFGRAVYDLSEDLRATLGVRYTRDEKEFGGEVRSFNRICAPPPAANCPNAQRFAPDLLTPPFVIPPGAFAMPPVFNPADGTLTVGFLTLADEEASYARTTWRGALEWDVSDDSLLYASYETGFKAGGFFFSSDSQTFAPETLEAFTLGWKNRLFDNRLSLDIEAFHWDYQDQQVSHITVDSRGIGNLRTSNVGQATIQGVEIEAQLILPTDTLLTADLQYLDATYDDFRYVTPLNQGPPVTGCLRTAGPSGFTVDCSGRTPPYAPEWTLNLGVEQTWRLGEGGAFVANARAHYQSETLTGLDFTPHEYQDAYWWFDASLTYRPPDDRYFVSLFARNLTDETVVANTFQPPFGSFVVGSLRPPRIIGVRLGARY